MASKQKMNLNMHKRSQRREPLETQSRMKRNRRRNYINSIVKVANGKLTSPVRDGKVSI